MPQEDIEIRSEEVQEILGTPPSWLLRWGSTLALITLVLIGWIGYWVPYPDTIDLEIKVSSTDPPKRLVTDKSAFISEVLVKNEDTVTAGQTLLAFKCKAKVEDVHTLDNHIIRVDEKIKDSLLAFNPPKDLLLGELQDAYYDFLEKREVYTTGTSRRFDNMNDDQLRDRIKKEQTELEYERRRKENLETNLLLVRQRYTREQNLLNERLSTIEKVRDMQEDVLTVERMVQGSESTIKNKQFEIELMRKQINALQRGSRKNLDLALNELRESFINLRNRVEEWNREFLIISPIDGVVLFSNETIGPNQFIGKETQIMVIAPIKRKEIVGRGVLKFSGSGKVRENNEVIVKFDSYPFEDFGAVLGVVSKKGKLATEGNIPIEVTFPNGLVTTTGRIIDAGQGMTGKARIITDKKRLIEWFFENVRKLFTS